MTDFTVLAFDYGLKNIGVAVGQSLIKSANELAVLKAKDGIPDWQAIKSLIDEWQPAILVIGLPLNMDGTDSELARRARKFGNRLNGRFALPIAYTDERLSTHEAKHIAQQRGHKGNYGQAPIDTIAASVLLESWWREQSTPM